MALVRVRMAATIVLGTAGAFDGAALMVRGVWGEGDGAGQEIGVSCQAW